MKSMNLENCKKVREILENELPAIFEQHGLKFELGNASYDSNYMKFSNFRIMPKDALSEEESLLIKYNNHLDLNKVARDNGRRIKLIGYKPRRSKFPYLVVDINTNKQYKYTREYVERIFAK